MNRREEPLISVIIPAYHVEKQIERCVKSICGQSYSHIEILLVCTDSEDLTREKCETLAKADNRITLLHSLKKGVSNARNTALEKAKGEYIAFVDADDYVEKDYLLTLFRGIQGKDISVCGFDRVKPKSSKPELMGSDRTYNQDELLSDILCNNTIGGYLWNKLFWGDIIRNNGLRFQSGLTIGEDMVFLVEYMKKAKRAYYCNQVCYHYCLNEDSALQKMYATGVFEESKLSNMRAAKYIAQLLDQSDGIIGRAVSYRMVRTGMWTMFNMLKCSYYDKGILKDIKQSMKGNVLAYCRNCHSRPVEKACAVCMYANPGLFWRMSHFLMHLLPEKILKGYVK